MFFSNLGYQWAIPQLPDDQGVLILPSCNLRGRVLNRFPAIANVLFDPQLYLAGLNPQGRTKACARLASYPWFNVPNIMPYDSDGTLSEKDWELQVRSEIESLWPEGVSEDEASVRASCRSAIEMQFKIPCSQIILPSPLIVEREDEASTQAEWLDHGLDVVAELDIECPLLATVALHEQALNDNSFTDLGFLATIVDQVASRHGIHGVYIVIVQDVASHPFFTSLKVLRAYAYLTKAFSEAGYEYIITNFADTFGLACVGLGATGYANGSSQSSRRISLNAFLDQGGGTVFPHFYSHPTVSEFATETALDIISENRLLRTIRDVTPTSERLMETLLSGGSASTLSAWAENRSNTKAAKQHFITRLSLEHRKLTNTPVADRLNAVAEWLETASARSLLISSRIGPERASSIKWKRAPAEEWLRIIES